MPSRSDSLAVRRTSAGLGLFTLKPIKARRRIIEYTGFLITNGEAEKKGGKYLFGIDEKYTLDGSARSNTARYVNHSCRPNAEAFILGRRVWIYSARDIEAGEETTFDYGGAYFDEHIRPEGLQVHGVSLAGAVFTGGRRQELGRSGWGVTALGSGAPRVW